MLRFQSFCFQNSLKINPANNLFAGLENTMKTILSQNLTLLLWVSLMASSFVVSKELLPYANPIASTGLRFILASIFMLPIVWITNIRNKNTRFVGTKVIIQYSFISLFLVLFFLGLFEALKTTSALRTSVIYTLVPLISVVLTYSVLKLKTSKTKIIGFILGTTGAIWVLLVINPGNIQLLQWNHGDSIFGVACFSLALHVILVKKWGADVPPAEGAFYIMAIGGIILLPFLFLFGNLSTVAWLHLQFWKTLLFLTIFTTMATFFLQQYLVQQVGPNRLLAFTYLIPGLVAIIQGLTVTAKLWNSLPGVLLTFLALYLISNNQTPRKQTLCTQSQAP